MQTEKHIVLPNTESLAVTQAAIAFEIAKTAISYRQVISVKPEEYAKEFTDIFITTWNKICNE
jgi:hypothetical protein